MSAASELQAVERIDRIVPRIRERPPRPRRPFPEVTDGEQPEAEEAEPESEPERKDEPSDEDGHLVDIVVRGRFLPTGQILPQATLHAP